MTEVENKKKCYIYTRVSTAMQIDGYSLEAQEDRLRKYADAYGMEVVRHYSDEGKSGKYIEGRVQFQQMISDVEDCRDNVNCILVFKLSRFGRNAADILNTLEILERYDVSLRAVEESIDSGNGAGKLIISVLAAVAEMERKNIIVQTMAGRMQKARDGKWNGGQAPIGYRINSETGILEIDEKDAEVVRKIFDLFVNTDKGYSGVTDWLNNNGIQKRVYKDGENPFYSKYLVKRIIDNPVYCGKIAYGRTKQVIDKGKQTTRRVRSDNYELVDGLHEPIISEELFQLAQGKRKHTGKRTERNPEYTSAHILSNVLVCPMCGAHMAGHTSRKRKKKDGTYYPPYSAYECKHRNNVEGKPCTYKHIFNEKKLDDAVAEIIKKILENDIFVQKLNEKINSQVDIHEIEAEVEAERNSLKNTFLKIDYYLDQQMKLSPMDVGYEHKRDALERTMDTLYNEAAAIEVRVEDAEKRLSNLRQNLINLQNVYAMIDNFGELYEKCTEEEKKQIINTLIEKIEVYPEPMADGRVIKSVSFNFPVYLGDEEGKEVFLSKGNNVETVVLLRSVKRIFRSINHVKDGEQ